jgi:hypothetical protein
MATRTIARLYDSYADAQQVVQDLEAAGIPHSDISLVGRDSAATTDVTGTGTGVTGTGVAGTGTGLTGTRADVTGTGMAGSGAAAPGATTADAPVTSDAGYRDPAAAPATPAEASDRAGTGASIGTVLGGGAGLLAGIGALAIPGVGPVVAAGWLVATLSGAGVGAAAGGILGALTGAGVKEDDAHVYAEGLRRGGNLVTVRVDDADAARVEQILNSRTYADPATRRTEYTSAGWSRFDENAPLAGSDVPGERPPIRHT